MSHRPKRPRRCSSWTRTSPGLCKRSPPAALSTRPYPLIQRSTGSTKVLQVYDPTIKELIHEQCDDGIMSAINFRLDVRRVPDPAGDRVVVTLDGKFLPYQW